MNEPKDAAFFRDKNNLTISNTFFLLNSFEKVVKPSSRSPTGSNGFHVMCISNCCHDFRYDSFCFVDVLWMETVVNCWFVVVLLVALSAYVGCRVCDLDLLLSFNSLPFSLIKSFLIWHAAVRVRCFPSQLMHFGSVLLHLVCW